MNLLTEGIDCELVEMTEMTRKLTIGGKTKVYPVYRVHLDLLFYNDQNDRITTWIEEYRLKHGDISITTNDREAYNNLIEGFIVNSNPEKIKQTKNNIMLVDQREPGITLQDGRIVDGNRRFTCLRQLHADNPAKFAFFETVILTENIQKDAKHIKMLELMVQHGEEQRVDYDPIDRLAGLYNDVERHKLLTVKEYANSVNRTEKEVETDLEVAKLLVEYLDYIQMPYQFHIARKNNMDSPLREVHSLLKNEKDEDRRFDMKQVIFGQFVLNPIGDMTRYMRKVRKILKDKRQSEAFLEQQMDIAERVMDKISDSKEFGDNKLMETLESFKRGSDEAIRAQQVTERFDERIRATANREQAAHTLDKALDSINELDTNIFAKLSEEQLQLIREKSDELIDSVQQLKEATYVSNVAD